MLKIPLSSDYSLVSDSDIAVVKLCNQEIFEILNWILEMKELY